MKTYKGFAGLPVLLAVLAIVVLGGVGYAVMSPGMLQAPSDMAGQEENEKQNEQAYGSDIGSESIEWRFSDAGEKDGMPQTAVTVLINGKTYDMGAFTGSCSEVGATGGVDGTGLLTGQISSAQCWFAGGGNEIGVFGFEEGGVEIMVGELSEGEEGAGIFRGNFQVKHTIRI